MNFEQPEVVQKYFPDLPIQQQELFAEFGRLFALHNAKLNLVSKSDLGNLFVRHILHSLSIARFVNFREGTRVMDLGTGGGFPGIPLAIFYPKVRFTLIDSISKKIRAVDSMINDLGLANANPVCVRAEDHDQQFDFVVTRAAASAEKLVQWTFDKVSETSFNHIPNGLIALKGGDLTTELSSVTKEYKVIDIRTYFEEDFFETKKILYIRY